MVSARGRGRFSGLADSSTTREKTRRRRRRTVRRVSTQVAKPPAAALAQMLLGNQVQQALHVAAKLGIADALHDGALAPEEVARATGTHREAVHRLLRALAGLGIVEEDAEGRFALTPLGAPLAASASKSVHPFALWSGGVSYQAFGALEHSVRTGEPAFEHVFGGEFFAYLAAHPEQGAVFDAMMARHTAPVARAFADQDLGDAETVVDVGGGHGLLLAALLSAQPRLRGVLFDDERVAGGARAALARAGVGERCRVVAGDMLDAVPPGDAYVLKSVLHGLDDEAAVRVLSNCRRAMAPGGRVYVIELAVSSDGDGSPNPLMDLLMLVGCHGRERSADELASLFARAGLAPAGVTPLKHGYGAVAARAA
jgi:SAM-dependent methyltransferase